MRSITLSDKCVIGRPKISQVDLNISGRVVASGYVTFGARPRALRALRSRALSSIRIYLLADCPSIPISAGSSRFHSFYPVSRRSPQRGIQNPAFSRSKPHDRCICMQAHARPEKAWLREAIIRTGIFNIIVPYTRTACACACILYVHTRVYYTTYYTVLLYYDNRGNAHARSFVAQRIQCTCIRYIV